MKEYRKTRSKTNPTAKKITGDIINYLDGRDFNARNDILTVGGWENAEI